MLEEIELIIDEIAEVKTAAAVFDQVPFFARLPIAEYGKIIEQLKNIDGLKFNQNHLEKAVNEERKLIASEELLDELSAEGLPVIITNGKFVADLIDEVKKALFSSNNPPIIYQQNGRLLRANRDDNSNLILQVLSKVQFVGRIERIARFVTKNDLVTLPSQVPNNVIQDIYEDGAGRGWPSEIPFVEGITHIPIIKPDGSILDRPGYDQESRMIYDPSPDLNIPEIPGIPTFDDVDIALDLIYDLIAEFPFVEDGSLGNIFAAILTPFVRPLFEGPTPLAVFNAKKAGTGKTLLISSIAKITTGQEAPTMSIPNDDAEMDKRITTLLSQGRAIIVLDNLDHPLNHPSLATALTTVTYQGRILGHSKIVDLPQKASWFCSGNNVRLGGDMPRRSYFINLDAKISRPWARDKFKYPLLLKHIGEIRGEIIAACLTIARYWVISDKPKFDIPSFGSYQAWAETVGSIIANASVEGFLANLNSSFDNTAVEEKQWGNFIQTVGEIFGERKFTSKDLANKLKANESYYQNILPDELSGTYENNNTGFTRSLGQALAKREGTHYGENNSCIRKAKEASGISYWIVEKG